MHLSVFDLDHTLLNVNSSFRFGSFLYRQNFFSFWKLVGCLRDYARYQWLGMSIQDLHAKTFRRVFKGQALQEVCHYVDQFLTESLDKMIYQPAIQRLKKSQDAGDYVLILSSSPDFLVREIAHRFEVKHWKSTIYQCNEEGKLETIAQVMEGQNKADYLKGLIQQLNMDRTAITVYSDSYLDLPLLNMAGRAIGVGPDHRLKRICLQKGWEIL